MKKVVANIVVLLITGLSLWSQNLDTINEIDQYYQKVVQNEKFYSKKVIDKSEEQYSQAESDETIRKLLINYFIDEDTLVLIIVYDLMDHMFIKEKTTEFVFKQDNLVFVKERLKEIQWEGYDNLDNRTTKLSEIKCYFNDDKCIRLKKVEAGGKLKEIDSLLNLSNEIIMDSKLGIRYKLKAQEYLKMYSQ